jgi:hypothetical protein
MIPGITASYVFGDVEEEADPTLAISMNFDAGDGSTTFTDLGGSVWTIGAGAVEISEDIVIEGASSLFVPAAGYLKTAYVAGNRIPADGDWRLKFKARATSWLSAGSTGAYILSVQDATPTAAGTVIAIATDSFSRPVLVVSDGTTRSVLITGTDALTTAATVTFEVKRIGDTIDFLINDVSIGTGTFTGSFPVAADQDWRIGTPTFADRAPVNGMYFDTFSLVRDAIDPDFEQVVLFMPMDDFPLVDLSTHAATVSNPYLALAAIADTDNHVWGTKSASWLSWKPADTAVDNYAALNDFGSDEWTIEFAARIQGSTSANQVFMAKANGSGTYPFLIYYHDATARFGAFCFDATVTLITLTGITDVVPGVWYWITLRRVNDGGGDVIEFWVQEIGGTAVLQDNEAITGNLLSNTDHLRLGTQNSGGYLNGNMQNLRISTVARPPGTPAGIFPAG